MPERSPLLSAVLLKIDEANSQDPNTETCPASRATHPKELLYSQRMTEELLTFEPNASEYLQIAARAQHIERWKSPRNNYAEGRAGYNEWRTELALFHAECTIAIMKTSGYSSEDCDRVKRLIQKKQLRSDTETQTLEDVICLVFLKHYFDAFSKKHDEGKIIDIVKKTWKKMSDRGHQAALKIQFPPNISTLVTKALA